MERPVFLTEGQARSLGLTRAWIDEAAKAFSGGGSVILRERDPVCLLTRFFAALESGCALWLASPDWGVERMREVEALEGAEAAYAPEPGSILIPTGGTTGRLRYAVHTWATLCVSATGFLKFFGQTEGHCALCVLPMYHVSGLMQAVRVATAGGRLIIGDAHNPRAGLSDGFSPKGVYLSLVPTQLARLLDAGEAPWLRQFDTIIVGGAALDDALSRRAFDARLPLAPSYGMTETAAAVCALRPAEFLSGAQGVGRALAHVQIELAGADGIAPSREHTARIQLRAASLCRALVPDGGADTRDGILVTNDLGWLDADGGLHISGRADRVIVSGGQKIDPEEVQAVLMATGLVREAVVIGVPDAQWGSVAAAYYVPSSEACSEEAMRDAVRKTLSPVHVPKIWKRLIAIPRTDAGKIDMALMIRAESMLDKVQPRM
jgi:o-succinylbenzoate---CoA ligase